jgi:hypothetical protein
MSAPLDPAAARQAAVERARAGWMRALMDLSRRNNLLYFRDLPSGTLEIPPPGPAMLNKLLGGESIAFQRLLGGSDDGRAEIRVRAIARRALANLEEKGVQTLFVALGMATWSITKDGRPPAAAVLLLPVAIDLRGHDWRGFSLRRTGEVQINSILSYVLAADFGCALDSQWLLDDLDDETTPFDPESVYSRLREVTRAIEGFAIAPRCVLSNFSFQKMAMVNDLRDHGAELAAHPIIAALAGDEPARQALSGRRPAIDPHRLDRADPAAEFLILDADSSQRCVVQAALDGQNGVIQGPPGTGKSQTIVNLIASLAARGQRVLFVAEKRAAIEVVRKRLELAGLGHLALDLHDADLSRRAVVRRFA